jgi:pilus assembly protein CpaE
VITVSSAKGGVGRTLVATNLAVGLARTGPSSTVLVDLDLQFGDVASVLGLDPEYSLPDAVRGLATRDTMVLKTFLTLHPTGLYVICGPKTPGEGDTVGADAVSRLLEMLKSEFQYVVVDTGVGLSEHVLAALDESSDVVLVSGMDVPGVRDLRKELDALTRLGLVREGRHVLLNFVDERTGLSVADVEATLGVSADFLLPRSLAALTSINEGVPLLQRPARREPVTKQLQRLQAALVPGTPVHSGVSAPARAAEGGPRRTAPVLPASRWGRRSRTAT